MEDEDFTAKEHLDPMSGFWSKLKPKQRLWLIAGVLFITLMMAVLLSGVLSEEYGVLFSDLEHQDAAVITKKLDSLKVEYQLGDQGKTIKIAKHSVHRTRLKLMENGVVINSGVGFELFDKDNFGATEYAQKINYQRALQGELERTIQSFNIIKRVRVHLVLRQKSLFKQKTNGATASVTVTLKKRNQLSVRQVLGIQNLVSAAVPGLTSSQVTVLDNSGITLSRNQPHQRSQMAVNEGLAKTRLVEHYLAEKAQKILDSIYGPEQASVSVNVVLALDDIRKKRESYTPVLKDRAAVKRKTTNDHEMTKKKGTMNSRRSSEIVYVWDKTIEQIAVAPGAIKKLSVAVVVPIGKNNSNNVNMQEVVARAVGLNKDRGDQIVFYTRNSSDRFSIKTPFPNSANSVSGLPARLPHKSDIPKPVLPVSSSGVSSINKPSTKISQSETGSIPQLLTPISSWISRNPQLTLFVLILFSCLIFVLVWRVLSLRTYRVVIAPTEGEPNEHVAKEKVLVDIQDWIDQQTKHKKAS